MEKLAKNSTIKLTASITESKVFGVKEMAPTSVPMVNVALSGKIDGGLSPGLLMLAGPSKHFKSAFALLMAAAYQKKHPDAVVLFYDSEFGTPQAYFESFGVNMDQVIHTPITDVEQLKFDIMQQLEGLTAKDKVVIIIDSIGNLASKKEVDDAMSGKSVADMSRAKQMKSLFRMITPQDIVSGGTGAYYSADAIWIIGRQQEKVDKEIKGYHFIINIEKSRHVREKSKIPVTVTFEGGISKWSGLLEVAEAGGYVVKPKVGWYEAVNPATGEVLLDKMVRAKEIVDNKEFWLMMFKETDFATHIRDSYTMATKSLIDDDSQVPNLETITDA